MGWAPRPNVALALVLRTKKFKMGWLIRGQGGERSADQTILWRFITKLLMKDTFKLNGKF